MTASQDKISIDFWLTSKSDVYELNSRVQDHFVLRATQQLTALKQSSTGYPRLYLDR